MPRVAHYDTLRLLTCRVDAACGQPGVKRQTIWKALLLVGSMSVAAGLSEWTVRFMLPRSVLRGETVLFEFSERLGWQLAPHAVSVVEIPDGIATPISINAYGMRDQPRVLAKAPAVRRIAVLGDSFLLGFGVADADLVTTRLQRDLLPGTEVLNFGVSGYGPLQECLLLGDRARLFSPDVVVLMLYLGNDLDDLRDSGGFMAGYSRPRALIGPGGSLVIENLPVPAPRAIDSFLYGLRRFELYHVLARASHRLTSPAGQARGDDEGGGTGQERDQAFDVLRVVLSEMARTVADLRAELVIVGFPGRAEASRLASSSPDLTDPAVASTERTLRAIASQVGASYVDLTHPLARAIAVGTDPYFPAYAHWNSRGHLIAAEAIAAHLRSRSRAG